MSLLLCSCTTGEVPLGPREAGSDARQQDATQARDAQSSTDAAILTDAAIDDAKTPAEDARVPANDAALADCEWQTKDGIAVIEAESLALTESWAKGSAGEFSGYSGGGYIYWDGNAYNSDPSHGVMQVRIALGAAGRYKMQWRNRIGIGDNATEHNDTWVRFAGVDDYFGASGPSGDESRRYAKPQCEDGAFMDSVRALSSVSEASCAAGSTKNGWMKVYSSGATDWKWSTRTSDNDAHDIYLEVSAPGVVTLELAARSQAHLIDRIVIHLATVTDNAAQNLALTETPCP